MEIHTEVNEVQSWFDIERMILRMRQILEEELNRCAEQCSEKEEETEEPPVQQCTTEMDEVMKELSGADCQPAMTEPKERGYTERTVGTIKQYIVKDNIGSVLPGYGPISRIEVGCLDWNTRARSYWYGHTPEKPICTWICISGRTTGMQTTDQLHTHRLEAEDTGGRPVLKNYRMRKKQKPWHNMINRDQLHTSGVCQPL